MKHQWMAYAIVALLAIGAGVAIAGLPDNVPVGDTIVATAPKGDLDLDDLEAESRRFVVAGLLDNDGDIDLFVTVLGLGLFQGLAFIDIFMVAISQMVSMVPEGLPVALTVGDEVSIPIGVFRARSASRRMKIVSSRSIAGGELRPRASSRPLIRMEKPSTGSSSRSSSAR
mgnify:CR=1 FL=1